MKSPKELQRAQYKRKYDVCKWVYILTNFSCFLSKLWTTFNRHYRS